MVLLPACVAARPGAKETASAGAATARIGGVEALRPVNILLAVREVLLHRHGAAPCLRGGPARGQGNGERGGGNRPDRRGRAPPASEYPARGPRGPASSSWCCSLLAWRPGPGPRNRRARGRQPPGSEGSSPSGQ